MAYAAVISLKHTFEQLILLVPSSTQIIEFAHKEVNSLHKHLKELNIRSSKRSVNALDEEMREELCKFEGLIDSHLSNLLLSQSKFEQGHLLSFSADLHDLKPEIRSFTVALKKMKWVYLRESRNTHDDDDNDDDDVSFRLIDSGGNKPKFFASYSDDISFIKEGLMSQIDGHRPKVFSFVGMAGIGKTTLAMDIFEDPNIVEHFQHRAWVRFGRKKYNYIKNVRQILAQLNPDSDKLVLATQEYEEISRDLRKSLKSKRCLIVLDDVWDIEFIHDMNLPYELYGSRVLVTTRLQEVASCDNLCALAMGLMNKEESWNLFCAELFAEGLCPPELVKPGKKIVEKSEGLPLLIVTIANLLSKEEKNLEYWNKVAEDKKNRLLKDACREIQEVLFPSYDHLPQHLKTCFLYMGVFHQDYEIPKSNIINLWTAEGFLESDAMKCLEKLVLNNVVLIYQTSTCSYPESLKTCGLHCSFWYLCNREGEKNKFLHVLNNLEDCLEVGIKGHSRLCIHNNVLFGIKNVYSSIERVCTFTARSLLCFGPYHQYAVPICFGLRLLKVLDALAIRFYDFPGEVLKLVQLRYLAITCNGKLPHSISGLSRLRFLIVGRHQSIKSCRAPSHLPIEIWNMKELQHLQVMGSDLPDPCGNLLPKLLRLIGVSAHSCTKEVLQGIPHLKKLGILIELVPDAKHEPLRCFDHISNLKELQSLKCVVVNPMFVTPSGALFPMMPPSLKKLHLSGLGYPWEYMTTIASLPNLEVLKLRRYAFRGPKWEIQENGFLGLCTLLIEDTDLVQLKAGYGTFRFVRRVIMKHCYKFQKLHLDPFTLNLSHLGEVEFVDCNPLARVHQLKEDGSPRNFENRIVVHCSWNDMKLKSSQPTNWSKRKFLKPM